MAFIVVYDANVLYPNVTRDLLIRIAQAGLVQAKWTDKILDETFTALSTKLPEVDGQKWERVRRLMQSAIRDGLVVGYEPLIDVVSGLPDPDDRHVVAAAIKCKARDRHQQRPRFPRICAGDLERRSKATRRICDGSDQPGCACCVFRRPTDC